MQHVTGPDFPTIGRIIVGRSGIRAAYATTAAASHRR